MYIILYIFLLNSFIFTKNFNRKLFDYKTNIFLYDYGQNWDKISLFNDISYLYNRNGIKTKNFEFNNAFSFFSENNTWGMTNYYLFNNGSFYAYKLNRMGENMNLFRLNPKLKQQKTIPLKIGLDYGGVGYDNEWISIKIAKGNQNWGSGQNIELALSENSELYDYFEIKSDYGKIRVKYIHGFLESTDDNINRYLTAKGVEWTNKRNILLGFSEIIIYSGYDRSFDLAYLNPLSFHLETELNNRLNFIGNNQSNAVWTFHSDFFIFNDVRISFNFLYDEFVLDPEVELSKQNGKAYSIRFSYSPDEVFGNYINFYLQNIYVGTPTFRHGNGTNNFVQSNYPLGWERGSDSQELSLGLNYFNKQFLIWQLNTGYYLSGDENIQNRVFDPYLNYLKGTFPSGKIKKEIFLNSSLEILFKKYFSMKIYNQLSYKSFNRFNICLTYFTS